MMGFVMLLTSFYFFTLFYIQLCVGTTKPIPAPVIAQSSMFSGLCLPKSTYIVREILIPASGMPCRQLVLYRMGIFCITLYYNLIQYGYDVYSKIYRAKCVYEL